MDDGFKWWFTGFADGESCFYLGRDTQQWRLRWTIGLRADDADVLVRMQAYAGGKLFTKRYLCVEKRPQMSLTIVKQDELFRLVEHFEAYPLRTKKARDFAIWAEAVRLWFGAKRERITPSSVGARKPECVHAKMRELHDALRAGRAFR